MPREYVPVPIEYLAEMEPLSDENFGRLILALSVSGHASMKTALFCAKTP